jgi:hypothetical protein
LPVTDVDGRMPEVYPPLRQIVDFRFACVTAGEIAPGVHAGSSSGSPFSYRKWQLPAGGCFWTV